MANQFMTPEAAGRLAALTAATLDRWVALSSDESHIVAEAETFDEIVSAAEMAGEQDPILLHVPSDWTPRVL